MNEEKLKKASQILKWINDLKDQQERWKDAKGIYYLELSTSTKRCREERLMEVDTSWVRFDDIRLLAIAKISKRIEELQNEFDNL